MIFLCQYLFFEEIRHEIQEGLRIIESWNSVNNVVFYLKSVRTKLPNSLNADRKSNLR